MSGLGSFIQGAFGGYSYGEQVKDNQAERKRREDRHGWEGDRQERLTEAHGWEGDRQERLADAHGWEQTRQGRLAEQHGWARQDRAYTGEVRERQREAWEREDKARQAHADAYEAARESYQGAQTPERGVIDGPTISTQGRAPGYDTERASPVMQTAPRGVMDDAPQAPAAPAARAARPSFDTAGASPVMRQGPREPNRSAPSMPQQERPSRGVIDTRPDARQPGAAPNRRTSLASRNGAPEHVIRAAREADGFEQMLNSGVYDNGQPLSEQDQAMFAELLEERDAMLMQWSGDAIEKPYRAAEQSDAAPNRGPQQARRGTEAVVGNPDAQPRAPREGQAPRAPGAEQPVARGGGRPQQPQAQGTAAGSRFLGQRDPRDPSIGSEQPRRAQSPAAPQSPDNPPAPTARAAQAAPKPGAKGGEATGGVPVEAESTEQLDDRAANAPIEEGGAPSVEAASETVTRGVIGEDGAVRSSPEADVQAEESFMDHYAKVGAPKVIEHYLKTGQVDKAQAYEEWLGSREVQGQMRSWAGAVRAAAIGDERGFITKLAETYNAVDDGYTVDPENSGFTKDESGNVVGGQVTFRDERTGETFTRVYENQSDLIEQGIYALAPEQMFEHLWSLNEQAQQTRTAGVERQRERADSLSEKIRKEADSIRENQPLGGEPLSEQDIMQRAEENVRRQEQVAAGFAAGTQSRQAPPNYRSEP